MPMGKVCASTTTEFIIPSIITLHRWTAIDLIGKCCPSLAPVSNHALTSTTRDSASYHLVRFLLHPSPIFLFFFVETVHYSTLECTHAPNRLRATTTGTAVRADRYVVSCRSFVWWWTDNICHSKDLILEHLTLGTRLRGSSSLSMMRREHFRSRLGSPPGQGQYTEL